MQKFFIFFIVTSTCYDSPTQSNEKIRARKFFLISWNLSKEKIFGIGHTNNERMLTYRTQIGMNGPQTCVLESWSICMVSNSFNYFLPLLHASQRIQFPALFPLLFHCPCFYLRFEVLNACVINDSEAKKNQFINSVPNEWMQFACSFVNISQKTILT